mgnify:CR=1 FL=1
MNKQQRVVCVDNATCFFGLLEECGPGGFYHNRRSVLDAYVDRRLFTVVVQEKTDLRVRFNGDFSCQWYDGWRDHWYMLPCFLCVTKDDQRCCDMLWVHPRIRNTGTATLMLNACAITSASDILEEAEDFWEKYFKRYKENNMNKEWVEWV